MDRFLRALLIFLTTARCDTESDYALSRVNDQNHLVSYFGTDVALVAPIDLPRHIAASPIAIVHHFIPWDPFCAKLREQYVRFAAEAQSLPRQVSIIAVDATDIDSFGLHIRLPSFELYQAGQRVARLDERWVTATALLNLVGRAEPVHWVSSQHDLSGLISQYSLVVVLYAPSEHQSAHSDVDAFNLVAAVFAHDLSLIFVAIQSQYAARMGAYLAPCRSVTVYRAVDRARIQMRSAVDDEFVRAEKAARLYHFITRTQSPELVRVQTLSEWDRLDRCLPERSRWGRAYQLGDLDALPAFKRVAQEFSALGLTFVHVTGAALQRACHVLQIPSSAIPCFVLYNLTNGRIFKHEDPAITLSSFVRKIVVDKKIDEFLISEAEPAADQARVRGIEILVGASFGSKLSQRSSHALVSVCARADGACAKFKPVFERIATYYNERAAHMSTAVTCLSIDGVANELADERIDRLVQSYPTVLLFKAGSYPRDEPLKYDGKKFFYSPLIKWTNKRIASRSSNETAHTSLPATTA